MAYEHVDVLVVGAGLSGIGAAVHLQTSCPGKSLAILESRAAIGGTWDLFRYPGVRSDSDMFTLGYVFKPWLANKSLADGTSIRNYIQETAREHGLTPKIRFNQRVVAADWSLGESRWTVEVERTDTGARDSMTCGFLYGCTGYYRYDEGYTPKFPGLESFQGQVIHPQQWPADLSYAGKRVIVIGSGATAVTLVPAMAAEAAHVTMVQRSPSYILSLPSVDSIARLLRRWLPEKLAYALVRKKNLLFSQFFYRLSRRRPKLVRKLIQRGLVRGLPPDFDIATHFTPRYDPWDQRLCVVPDGDLFKAVHAGKASLVTDGIKSFTAKGILLDSGKELEADIVVTATGLNVLALGGMKLSLNGALVKLSEHVSYKGMMLSGIPNLALVFGYTNASWTLKADLVSGYVCRLLNFMDEKGFRACTPKAPDPSLPTEPMIDLKSGYVTRAINLLPRQGAKTPWRLNQDYAEDTELLLHGAVDDGELEFSRGLVMPSVSDAA